MTAHRARETASGEDYTRVIVRNSRASTGAATMQFAPGKTAGQDRCRNPEPLGALAGLRGRRDRAADRRRLAGGPADPPVQLESRLTEALGRPTTIESVAFDPLRLRLTIRNFAIADPTA